MNVVVLPLRGEFAEMEGLDRQVASEPPDLLTVRVARLANVAVRVWKALDGRQAGRIDLVGHGAPGQLEINRGDGGVLAVDQVDAMTGTLALQQFFPRDRYGMRVGELRLLGCNTGVEGGLLSTLWTRMWGVRVLGTTTGIKASQFEDGLFPVESDLLVSAEGTAPLVPRPPEGPGADVAIPIHAATWRNGPAQVGEAARTAFLDALTAPIVVDGGLMTGIAKRLVMDDGVGEQNAEVVGDWSGLLVRGAETQLFPFREDVDLEQRRHLVNDLGGN